MNILAIDTVTECCSVALRVSRGAETQRYTRSEIGPAQHSRLLFSMLDACLAEAQLSLAEVDLLAVDVGPGSFTGVRIGIGVAQGLAYGMQVDALGLNSLEVLAWQALHCRPQSDYLIAAIDARMQQIYCGVYAPVPGDSTRLEMIVPPSVCSPRDLTLPSRMTRGAVSGSGSGWDQYHATLSELKTPNLSIEWLPQCFPQAATIAQLAAHRATQAHSPLQLSAHYVRDRVVNA